MIGYRHKNNAGLISLISKVSEDGRLKIPVVNYPRALGRSA